MLWSENDEFLLNLFLRLKKTFNDIALLYKSS